MKSRDFLKFTTLQTSKNKILTYINNFHIIVYKNINSFYMIFYKQ